MRRSLTIRTEPPGALVYVNDVLKGASPVTYDFTWYGWHRLTLRKEGFERVDDRRLLRAPVYLWIPLDLAMELAPFPIHDDRTWSYTLAPSAALPEPVAPATEAGTPPKGHTVGGVSEGSAEGRSPRQAETVSLEAVSPPPEVPVPTESIDDAR